MTITDSQACLQGVKKTDMGANNTFETAFKFHTLSRCVIPSGGGPEGKAALIRWKKFQEKKPTDSELQQWEESLQQPKVWAMVTGSVSNLFVVDCDTPEAMDMMEATGLKPHVKTTKGSHYYIRWPSWTVANSSRLLPGVDIRGQGGYVNFCGTNGKASYEVLIMPTDDTLIPIEKLPAELQKALQPKPKTLADRILKEALDRAQPGNRNETGLWLACQLRDNDLNQTKAQALMLRYVAQIGNIGAETYTESEALDSLNQAFTRPARERWNAPAAAQVIGVFNLTDMGNAERLVKHYGHILRYCYERKRWLVWNGKVWEWDMGAKIKALSKLTVRNIYREAGDEPDEKRRKEIANHARSSESDHRINAIISMAESEVGIPVKVTELDTNPWLFNCLNGTMDLRTGKLLPHNSEHLITMMTPINYNPGASCESWLKFLDRVTDGSTELIKYFQKAVGCSLTGDMRAQVMFFLYGLGNNGKSTFITTIRKVMADYGGTASMGMFLIKDKNQGGPKEDLANLKGKRFIAASEIEIGGRLAVVMIKEMTGGEAIRADRKYEHEIEFQPTHKLWISGNHKPMIADSSLAIWRRIKLIPFTVTIPDNEIDENLPLKLESELAGILAWAIEGCLAWQQEGLKEPQEVTAATLTYRREEDILLEYIQDCCVLKATATVSRSDIYESYKRWCRKIGCEPVSTRTFRTRMVERGIKEGKSGGTRYWRGIGLLEDRGKADDLGQLEQGNLVDFEF